MNPDDQSELIHTKMLMNFTNDILKHHCIEHGLSVLGTKKSLAIRNDQLKWIKGWKIISENLS